MIEAHHIVDSVRASSGIVVWLAVQLGESSLHHCRAVGEDVQLLTPGQVGLEKAALVFPLLLVELEEGHFYLGRLGL